MSDAVHVIAYDIGTTGAKACLYSVGKEARLIAGASTEYPLALLPDGGVEQDPADWWKAVCTNTRKLLADSGLPPAAVQGLAFCCQMQGLVLVDAQGKPVRPAMSYMDQRAVAQKRAGIERGFRIAGMNARKLIPSLLITGGVSASVKDPVWKYHWVREREPQCFRRVSKWLDAKEYLVHRCTGRFAMTPDSANATFLYDTRPGRAGWSPLVCRLFDVDPAHLPDVIRPAETAGTLLAESADEMGLAPGTPVFGGGGDLSLVALGSGAVGVHDTHVYMGTSGWVSTVTDRRVVDTDCFIASILGAQEGRYNYISEQETSGKCLEWARDHLALDEIGVYLQHNTVTDDPEGRYATLFELLDETIDGVQPGAQGVIFTPWLRGNRSPFEDPAARGMFFNLGLETGKRAMIRAVAEGIALHGKWQLAAIRRKVPARGPVRFVGGGARSNAMARIMADALEEVVEPVVSPQNAGALGAAFLCALGLGVLGSLEQARNLVPLRGSFEPDSQRSKIYSERLAVFRRLHERNRQSFRELNGAGPAG
ncbi:MAG: FGGY-family carbohydrate kinase [Spirochaetia bacterium]|jgi:xylulokinase